MDDVDLHLLSGEFLQGIAQRLDGTVNIALDDEVEFLELAHLDASTEFLKRHCSLGPHALLTLQLLSLCGNGPGVFFVREHIEFISCIGGAIKAKDRHRGGWTCFFDALATLVEHRLDSAAVLACKHGVSHFERAGLHQNIGDVTASFVQAALHDGAQGTLVGVGLKIEQLRLQQDLLQKLVHVGAKLGRDLLALKLAAPILHEDVHLGQLLFDAVWVGRVAVHFVDGKNHRDFCRLGVVDGFLGLGHHTIICCDDNDRQICDLGATCTHGRKGFVTRGVQECDLFPSIQFNGVGTNVLRDASGLASNDVGFPDEIKQ